MQASGSRKENGLGSSEQRFVRSVIDMQEDLPDSLKEFCSAENVKSCNDAFVLILHIFMLEVGFIPKDIPENGKLKLLPNNWHDSGVYRIVYYHSTCPEICCLMTCVPLQQILSVSGTVDDLSEFQPTTLHLQVKHYINSTIGFTDPSKFFCNVRELSQNFKDQFAYSMLAAMQDALGFGPTFGLPILMDDIKFQILSYLPVESLLRMSCVNKEFSELCNTPALWKNLYLRDFSVALVNSEEVKDGWKELYKKMYLKQKRQLDAQYFLIPTLQPYIDHHGWYPPVNPQPRIGPAFGMEIPEEIQTAFPQLRQRVICQPFPPQNSLLKIPGTFGFF